MGRMQNNPRALATVAEGNFQSSHDEAVQLKAEERPRVCFLEVFSEEVGVIFLWVVFDKHYGAFP